MGKLERLTKPIPYGQRVYVVGDFDLTPESTGHERGLRELVTLLNNSDDPTTIIVAGNFFHPPPDEGDLGAFIHTCFRSLPSFRSALARFTRDPQRHFIVLPGTHDRSLTTSASGQEALGRLGVACAADVMLQVATASGVRDISVVAGSGAVDVEVADSPDRGDAEQLDDPTAIARFAASRLLYRRLSKWFWFPLWAVIVVDLLPPLIRIFDEATHKHLHVKHTHPASLWSSLVINLITIAFCEAILAIIAGYIIRRRFDRDAQITVAQLPADPLAVTTINETRAIDYARFVAERGGAGAVIGGAPRPALVFLDRGVCAAPGSSRVTWVERRGRFGLPPVFSPVDRAACIEIEAAATVQVRLIASETRLRPHTRLERWCAAKTVQPSPSDLALTVGSWPTGEPWPNTPVRAREQLRRRYVRRLVSALLFLTGVANIAVGVSPPLRHHFHFLISVLPIGVVRSANAVTVVAGVAMIMLARGVRRGQRRPWAIASTILAITVVAHLLRGGSLGSTLLSLIALGILIISRENFTATTDRSSFLTNVPRLAFVAALSIVGAASSIKLGNIHHHLQSWAVLLLACTERLVGITTITLPDSSGDFVDPALLVVGFSLIISALYLVTRPVVDRRLSEHANTTERRLAELRARDIVKRHGRGTLDFFALRDDKQFFFFRDSLVAYAVYGGAALISPDPIGPVVDRSAVFNAFHHFAESRGWTVAIVAADSSWLPIYRASGLHSIYIGDEAIVDCATFSLEGGKMKGLRQACTRLTRHGYTVEFVDPATIDPAQVADIVGLIAMLRRGEGERGFSMMLGRLFHQKDQGLLLTIVRDPNGRPAAVCQFVPSLASNSHSLDLMRRDPGEHPNGLIDFALCSTIAHLRERGTAQLSLNFAAFRSILDGERGEGTFTRIERWTLKRLSGILPIETLWLFNNKYNPSWLPRYLVYPAAESFVPVVAAILRAESLTEIPVIGRLLANDPSNRPGTVVPEEILARAGINTSNE